MHIQKSFNPTCSKYRLISLLSDFDKNFKESLSFLKTNNLFYDFQFDFRQKHSSHSLINLR